MSSAIILDTETTGIDEPEVIELAYMGPIYSPNGDAEIRTQQFSPTKPMSLGALATHHIIEDDLVDCSVWPGKWELPFGTGFIVGHNIDFDWAAIGSPNVKRICTLALSRAAWPDIDSHKLGALIYHLYPRAMARELSRGAHSAATDVGLACRVLMHLVDLLGARISWEELWEISEKARVPTRMSFGKYGPKDGKPGMLISEMRAEDVGYVRWLLNNAEQVKNDPYLQKALTA